MTRLQRVAAYNVCLDDAHRLLVCRLSAITARPGSWTLPGGGVEFGEHPEEAAVRELHEETGLVGHVVELLAVDSLTDARHGELPDYQSIRILYRTRVDGSDVVHEVNGSTDQAAWCTREELLAMPLVATGRLGVRLAFGDA